MARQTPQRIAITAAFAAAGRPLGPHEILEAARLAAPSLNLATVYRTLKRMDAAGMLTAIELPGEPPRYQLRQKEEPHHHHFRCTNCDGVFCMKGCVEGLKRLLPKGFHMTGHEIVIYGLCRACGG